MRTIQLANLSDGILLYVDDIREPPPGWVVARSVNEAISFLLTGLVVEASLDHDMGWDEFSEEEYPNGLSLVKWMVDNVFWPPNGVHIHSANPAGRENMLAWIKKFGPY